MKISNNNTFDFEIRSRHNIFVNNPRFLVLTSILSWSFGILLMRLISIKSGLLNYTIQFFLTFLFFFFYSIFIYKKRIFLKILHIKVAYIFFGLFGYFIYWMSLFKSFQAFNSASETGILNYTFPLFTVIFRDIFFVKPKPKTLKVSFLEYGGLILGFVSVIIVTTHGNVVSLQFMNIPGILWGLLAGISYGIFSAYSSSVDREDMGVFFLAGTFVSLILAFFISLPELTHISQLTRLDYFYQLILAFIVHGVGYLTWAQANRMANILHISFSSLASLINVLPFLSLLIVSFFLKETELFKGYFLFSLILLIVSTYICQKSESIYDFFS